MQTVIKVGVVVCSLAMLAACGQTKQQRATGGAAAGAGTGAVVGAVAGPPGVLAGAAIGAATGAATGASTSPRQVNLGKPPWSNPRAHVAGQPLDQSARRD